MTITTMNFILAQLLLQPTPSLRITPDKDVSESGLPTGAAIIDRFIEVTGGKAAYDKVYNRVRHDRIVHVGMGFEDEADIYTARPDKRYIHITSEVMGNVENGSDGNIVWYQPHGAKPRVEMGEARLAQLSDLAFDRMDNWRAYYEKVELVRKTPIDGRPCYEVLMTPNVGRQETHYYDTESGLLVNTRKTLLSSFMPTIVFNISLSDYRAVDGILLPHKVQQRFEQCGSQREMIFITERVEHNVDLPSDRFTPPNGVLAAATVESIGGLIKGLVGGKEKTPPAPCGTENSKVDQPREDKKREARTKQPCARGY
jgi:hypothetical protein